MSYCLYAYMLICSLAHMNITIYVYMYCLYICIYLHFFFIFPRRLFHIYAAKRICYIPYMCYFPIYTAIYHYIYFFLHFCPKINYKMGTALHFINFSPYWNTNFPPLLPLKIALSLRDCRRRGFPNLL